MAANKGVTLFVLLLNCCHKAEQPINASSSTVTVEQAAGPATKIPLRLIKQEDMPEVFDEVLVQDVLNPNKSSRSGTHRTTAMLTTKIFKEKNASSDENYQGGPNNYHEPSDNSQSSLGSEDKILNNGSSVKDSYRASSPEAYETKTKNSKNDHDENVSILDKIFENIRKYSEIISNKLKRTSEAQRAESSQHGSQRGISVKQEILAE